MASSAQGRQSHHLWMLVDKTDEGVRIKIAPEEAQSDGSAVPEELRPNASTLVAKFVRQVDYHHEVALFDVAGVVVDDPKPASLETHLGEAASGERLKEAIVAFATTHCWKLVVHIVALFDGSYDVSRAFDFDTGCLRVTRT
jgi:hypothetical protein